MSEEIRPEPNPTAVHEADTADAHDASAVSVVPAGNITSTDVQAALVELDGDIAAGGIPSTIVDAKGDLIVATAADTVARRAVGSNGQVLTADSAEADGVKWAAATGLGAWTSYTPTISASTPPTIGNGTLTGRYKQLDSKTYLIEVFFQFGSTSAAGSGTYTVALPGGLTVATPCALACSIVDSSARWYVGVALASGTAMNPLHTEAGNSGFVSHNQPMAWAIGDQLWITGPIEVT